MLVKEGEQGVYQTVGEGPGPHSNADLPADGVLKIPGALLEFPPGGLHGLSCLAEGHACRGQRYALVSPAKQLAAQLLLQLAELGG